MWDEDARARLRAAIKRSGSLSDFAGRSGISAQGLTNLLSGRVGEPGVGKLERLATLAGVSIDYLLTGAEAPVGGVAMIPAVEDIFASAGHGATTLDFENATPIPFPKNWLRSLGGDPDQLALVQVRGDSMDPTIPHGSWVMFDRSRRGRVDGVYVLRIDGDICVKRLAHFDQEIRVRSEAERAYPEILVSYEDANDPSKFEPLGRVVWTGRTVL